MRLSFLIVDPTLRGLMGHSYEYDAAVREAALRAGFSRVEVVGAASMHDEVRDGLAARATLRTGIDDRLADEFPWKPLRDRMQMRRHFRRLTADLSDLPDSIFDAGERNLVLFPTVRHPQLTAIAHWLERVVRRHDVYAAVTLHFTAFPDFTDETSTRRFYRDAFRRIERSPIADRLRFFADSEELADEYAAITSLPVEVICVPHVPDEDSSTESPPPLRLVYLGDARRNKGYHLLPAIVDGLQAEFEAGRLIAEFQSAVRIGSELDVIAAAARMENRKGVRLIREPMSTEDYYSLLNRAHLLLLPYTISSYHSQTSGIFAEAVAAAKPTVVSRGTWPYAEGRRNDAAVVPFSPGDRASLVDAVRLAIEGYDDLAQQARRAAAKWREKHSPDRYLETLCGSFPGMAPEAKRSATASSPAR